VIERGEDGVARIKELTDGIGADAVLECVGTQESMIQAIHSTRPGGGVGYVGVPYEAKLDFISPGGGGGCSSAMSVSMAAPRRCDAFCPS
jgi:threonine dehydrogenase-like Zn-dependent dehydrogenase